MKEKILIINDDDGIRDLAGITLAAKGYEIFEASSGKMGVALALQKKPDLILLDIMMPEMNGYETCQNLKNSEITKNIPVIFFSSLTEPKDKIKGLELGAVDFVNNIVDRGELLARVQTHLHIKSLTHALMDSNRELIQKQKSLNEDLHAAAIIQKSFLPSNKKIPNIQFASLWLPANPLGGDIFNTVECGQNKTVFYMVDVSGHDVPSALVTVSVSQYLFQINASPESLLSPKQIMMALDKEYPLERFNRYFTIFYLIVDNIEGTLSYSSAGHPPAAILSKNKEIKLLNCGGTIIGLNLMSFEEEIAHLNNGDKVFLHTDGVTELKNRDGELYGMERLYSLLEKIKHEPPEEIVNQVQKAMHDFSEGDVLQDDTSIMCFEFNKE